MYAIEHIPGVGGEGEKGKEGEGEGSGIMSLNKLSKAI